MQKDEAKAVFSAVALLALLMNPNNNARTAAEAQALARIALDVGNKMADKLVGK